MEKAVISDNKPIKTTLEKDKTYAYCTCGRSAKQPFCDGSHKGTTFTPLRFTAQADKEVWLCTCKQTKNPPYCDGSHQHIADDAVGITA